MLECLPISCELLSLISQNLKEFTIVYRKIMGSNDFVLEVLKNDHSTN